MTNEVFKILCLLVVVGFSVSLAVFWWLFFLMFRRSLWLASSEDRSRNSVCALPSRIHLCFFKIKLKKYSFPSKRLISLTHELQLFGLIRWTESEIRGKVQQFWIIFKQTCQVVVVSFSGSLAVFWRLFFLTFHQSLWPASSEDSTHALV